MQAPAIKSAMQILDNAPLSIVMVKDSGAIVYANEKTSSLFGYTTRELIGQPLASLFKDSYGYPYTMYGREFFTTPCAQMPGMETVLTGLCRDGTEIPVQIRFASMDSNGGILIVAYIIDIKSVIERKYMDIEPGRCNNRLGLYILDDG